MASKALAWIIAISLVTQLLGLYCGLQYFNLIQSGEVETIIEQPEAPQSSLLILFPILAGTAVILIIIRVKKSLLRVIETVSIFFSSWMAFDLLIPFSIGFLSPGLLLSALLVAWKILRPSILNKNLAVIFSVAGAGAVIGASLGLLPILVLVVLVSIYDFISVFITKHMVYMLKAITETQSAFTISVPEKFKKPVKFKLLDKTVKSKFHIFQLGAGDMVFPLMFAVSILTRYSLLNAISSIFGSLIALGLLIYFIAKKPGNPMPALPIISAGMLAGFLVSVLFL